MLYKYKTIYPPPPSAPATMDYSISTHTEVIPGVNRDLRAVLCEVTHQKNKFKVQFRWKVAHSKICIGMFMM